VFSFLKGNVLVITVTRILGMFSRSAVMPYRSLYVLALGGTAASIGLVNSLIPLASLLIFPIAGFLADQSGRVKLIAIAGYLSALTYLFYIFANNWIILAIGAFIMGTLVFQFPAQSALMADSLTPKQRGIGFATASAIPGAVAVIAPYLAGHLIDSIGVDPAMRYLYTLLLISYVISATIQMKFLKDTIENPRPSSLSFSNIKMIIAKSYRDVAVIIKWMPTGLRALALVIALSFTANAVAGPFWVVYGTSIIGLSASEWGLLTLVFSAFRIALTIPAGVAIDRFGKRKTIITSIIITVPTTLYFVHAQGFLEVLIILVLLSVANAFLLPACSALMADIVPKEMRGRVMAILGRGALMINPGGGGGGGPGMGFLFAIPVVLGSITGGYIYSLNPTYPWILQFIALLGSLIVGLALLREPEKAEI
jgi:MFS family permease